MKKKNNNLKKLLKSLITEGDVVSLDQFKKDKEEGILEYYLVSKDGQMVLSLDDFLMVKIESEAQNRAIREGNVKKAENLGATFFEIEMGAEVEGQ